MATLDDGRKGQHGRRGQRNLVKYDHRLDCRQVVPHTLDLVELFLRGDEREARGGIREDVARLRLRQRRIHRHADRPVHEQREIREQPFRPALRHDRHAIAGTHAERAQPQREIAEPFEPFLCGLAADVPVADLSDEQRLRIPAADVKGKIGDGRQLGGGFRGG